MAESTGKEEKDDLEHRRETLDEEVQRPFLEPIPFALMVSAALDHRSARIPQVLVQPLFPQHGDECGQQGDQKARVHEIGSGDDLARWIFLNRWNDGGLAGDSGLIESEKDGAEEGHGLVVLVRVGLEVRLDVDNGSRTDGGEQTRLRARVR